jgi:DNA-binding transcriptional regulator YdaS (Cro superfamily)
MKRRPGKERSIRNDPGLEAALVAADGVGALARLIGVSVQTVSNWDRVPHTRVRAVGRVTGVASHILRPDLYDSPAQARLSKKRSLARSI